jgi:hypothetical protein
MPLGHSATPHTGGAPTTNGLRPLPLKHPLKAICGMAQRGGPHRADDGIRTRDPHLGKVMRYQLRYVRMVTTGLAPAPRPDA